MQFATLGNSHLQVSQICLETMTFEQQNTEAEAHRQLDTAFSRSINIIDAAEMYPVPSRAENHIHRVAVADRHMAVVHAKLHGDSECRFLAWGCLWG